MGKDERVSGVPHDRELAPILRLEASYLSVWRIRNKARFNIRIIIS